MSERVLSPQPVTQYNPITGEVRKESEKAAVVKKNYVVSKSKVAAVVSEKLTVVNESVVKSIEKSTVVKDMDVTSKVGKSNVSAVVSEKSAIDDNPKVSKVSDESNKAAVVAPVTDNVPVAMETDKETESVVTADVKAPVVAAVESVVEKDNPKVMSKVSDESVKESVKDKIDVVVKKSVKSSSVVADRRSSVVTDKVDVVAKKSIKASSVVADKTSSVVADKVDVVKDKVDVVADKASDALKNKLIGKGKKPVVVLRLSKQEENTKVKAKVNVKRKMILSKEDDYKKKLKADRKRKKLKIKAGLKRKRSGSDYSDSLEIDTKSIKLLISKLEKKVKKQESDEDSVPKKVNKEGDKIEVTPSKLHDMLGVPFGGYSLFDLDERETDHEFADGLKGQICLDVVRQLREDFVIFDIDWCGYIFDCLRDTKLPGGTNHYLGPLTFLIVIHFEFHVIQSLIS
nr:hypothetical protein [Tanacetum cinerariifolium]